VIWTRVLEFLPLALVLGAVLAALRHEEMAAIQRAAVRTTVRIVGGLVIGCAVLQAAFWLFQD
jgi:hypothetical protein